MKWGERRPAVECCCRDCGWRGFTRAQLGVKWFFRGYVLLSLLAVAADALKLIDLRRLVTLPVAAAILVALPLVPAVLGRFEACPSCRSRWIELGPMTGVDPRADLASRH
jgi:hypothetical protein